MAVECLADVSPKGLHVADERRGLVVESGVCAEVAEAGVVLGGCNGYDEGLGVVEAGLLDGVHAGIRGG